MRKSAAMVLTGIFLVGKRRVWSWMHRPWSWLALSWLANAVLWPGFRQVWSWPGFSRLDSRGSGKNCADPGLGWSNPGQGCLRPGQEKAGFCAGAADFRHAGQVSVLLEPLFHGVETSKMQKVLFL